MHQHVVNIQILLQIDQENEPNSINTNNIFHKIDINNNTVIV